MQVYLKKDVVGIGMAGEIVKVTDGYGKNYLIPRALALEVTLANEGQLRSQARQLQDRKEVIKSKTSMLAEKIKSLKLVMKCKIHDGEKMYGSIHPQEIVDLLAKEGVKVTKSQIIFPKAIKERGTHDVVVKLSSSLQPTCTLKIVAE
jgi:large subunit ribosomal protein L9